MMNRRGHIGTLLLVFGALILVGYALFVMLGFGDDFDKKKAELNALSEDSNAEYKLLEVKIGELIDNAITLSKDKGNFESSFRDSLKTLAEKERFSGQNSNVYAKLTSKEEYQLYFNGENYVLFASELFNQINVGNNEVRYNYNLIVVFNENSIVSFSIF